MALTFTEQADLADDQAFQRRVKQALIKAAIAIRGEDAAVENHAARVAYASQLLSSPERYAVLMAQAVATDPGVTAEVEDDQLEGAVIARFDAFTPVGGG